MKTAIYGAGGFGKEVEMLLNIISARKGEISFAGFLDDFVKRRQRVLPVAHFF